MSAVADKLREARALVARPGGWCQGDYEHGGGLCVVGAIRVAAGGDPFSYTFGTSAPIDAFRTAIGGYFADSWNDEPGRTQAEVLAAFDRAIELAESEQ